MCTKPSPVLCQASQHVHHQTDTQKFTANGKATSFISISLLTEKGTSSFDSLQGHCCTVQTDKTTCNLDGVIGSSSRHMASVFPFNVMRGMSGQIVLLCTSFGCGADMTCCPVLVFCASISKARKYFCMQAQSTGRSASKSETPSQLSRQGNLA